jgi:SAM-dependent methyltransferase
MGRKHNEASRRFHDRVATRYDSIYDDPYWEFHDRVTWAHLKNFLPKDAAAPVMDLGCGTGKWGLKLLKAGYPTTFTDLSPKMLEEVRAKLALWAQQPDLAAKVARAGVTESDAVDLMQFPAGHFGLIVAMGDVVSICSDPARAIGQVHRLLAPGGVFVFTVDNHLAALDHFREAGNLEELSTFVKTGQTHWLTKSQEEQFEVHMFLPGQIESLLAARGFAVISRIGKTILPVRQNKKFFESEDAMERLVKLEQQLAKEPTAHARASHIQIAARKAEDAV